MTTSITDLQAHWPPIAPLFLIRSDAEYDSAVARLNSLLDEIGTNEAHPLYELLDTLGTLIHIYETEHCRILNSTGQDVLRFLMKEHQLSTADLPEIGSAQAVDRYLAGDAELTLGQVRDIAQRFQVSTAVFV